MVDEDILSTQNHTVWPVGRRRVSSHSGVQETTTKTLCFHHLSKSSQVVYFANGFQITKHNDVERTRVILRFGNVYN